MSPLSGVTLLYIVAGVVICFSGVLIVWYPEVGYAVRAGWKHDDATLSDRGRTDQRVMGVIIFLIGIGLLLRGVF